MILCSRIGMRENGPVKGMPQDIGGSSGVAIEGLQDGCDILAPDIKFGTRIKYYPPQFQMDNISLKVGGCKSQILATIQILQ